MSGISPSKLFFSKPLFIYQLIILLFIKICTILIKIIHIFNNNDTFKFFLTFYLQGI